VIFDLPWYGLAVVAAFFIGSSTILKKRVLFHEHALEFLTVFFLFSTLSLLPFIEEVSFSHTSAMWFLVISKSIIMALGVLYVTKALRHLDISIVQPLFNINLILVLALAFFILGERITLMQSGGVLLVMIGAYLLGINHRTHHFLAPFKAFGNKHYKQIVVGVIFLAVSVLMDRLILHPELFGIRGVGLDEITFLFFYKLVAAIFLILFLFAKYDGKATLKHALKNGWVFILLASLFDNAGQFFYFSSVSLASISVVLPIARLHTLYSAIVGGEMYHEKNLVIKSVATVVMIAGAWLIIV
jgi:drug/metabolite transporter (DMT)-like permease